MKNKHTLHSITCYSPISVHITSVHTQLA